MLDESSYIWLPIEGSLQLFIWSTDNSTISNTKTNNIDHCSKSLWKTFSTLAFISIIEIQWYSFSLYLQHLYPTAWTWSCRIIWLLYLHKIQPQTVTSDRIKSFTYKQGKKIISFFLAISTRSKLLKCRFKLPVNERQVASLRIYLVIA